MSEIRVNRVVSDDGSSLVSFPAGVSGDSNSIKLEPKIVQFSPKNLEVGVSSTTNIVITFDQDIQFSGVGTIFIRANSKTGEIFEEYDCGVDPQVTISGSQLTINPTGELNPNTDYHIMISSPGIANTYGHYYVGNINPEVTPTDDYKYDTYSFRTEPSPFSMIGGNAVYELADGGSPTGTYRYHIFTGSGPLITYSNTFNSPDIAMLIVAGGGGGSSYPSDSGAGGGGGGGGVIYKENFSLAAGSYTVTIGAGGAGTSPTSGISPNSRAGAGEESKITTLEGTDVFRAFGGGAGGGSLVFPWSPIPLQPIPSVGGSGGGAGWFTWSLINWNYATNAFGGIGIEGQGNPGGGWFPLASSFPFGPDPHVVSSAAGGGGAFAQGGGIQQFPYPPGPGPYYKSGNGGAGRSIVAFGSPKLGSSGIPAPSVTEIAFPGRYGGGGGGGAGNPPTIPRPSNAGQGGSGGGGHGGNVLWPTTPDPGFRSTFPPEMPQPYEAQPGFQHTGGGGGGNGGPYTTTTGPIGGPGGQGGSGVVMIRYAV
jgi:hypothetical protein